MMDDYGRRLLDVIGASPSPFHTVEAAEQYLLQEGFQELSMEELWHALSAGKYFTAPYGTCLFAFVIGEQPAAIRMAAAHTDSPCFRIKEHPEIRKAGCGLLNIEPYGGMIMRSWLDRPLSIAGRVLLRGADAFSPRSVLVDCKRALLTIPSLAIHMDREVNEGGELNAQTDLLPLSSLLPKEGRDDFFRAWLCEQVSAEQGEILSYELNLYPTEEGGALGLEGEFISAPRLDNLTSVQACLEGIGAASQADGVRLVALFDHEEIGSRTKQGAGSLLLAALLRRIYRAIDWSAEQMEVDLARGYLLSVDVAHGLHPNHLPKHDPTNRAVLGKGFAIKQAASQSYASDAEAAAMLRALAEDREIPWQSFMNRSDARGGSTLGSIASSITPVRAIDIGVPVLAMHSVRELMAGADQSALVKILQAYFTA